LAAQASLSQPTTNLPAMQAARGGCVPQKGQGAGRSRRAAVRAPRWMTCSMFMAEYYKNACDKSTSNLVMAIIGAATV
jgi:hypothetical protein